MSKTLAPSRIVTTREPKGLKFMSIVDGQYNKACLSEEEAQRVNDTPGLAQLIASFIAENRRSDRFKNEEVRSNWAYPPEYTGFKPIVQQVDILAGIFGLSLGATSEYIEKVLPTLTLPDGAEGWIAIPSVDAVTKRFFPEVTDLAERNCRAVELVLEKIGGSRRFHNYRAGQITTDRLRVSARTAQALAQIAETQTGDILIIPAQFGLRHRGRSVRRAREVFTANEFGLGWFAVGCMILTHPERFVRWEQLHTECSGDDFAPAADGQFGNAPVFSFDDGQLRSGSRWAGRAHEYYGSVSGFLPQ